MPISAVGEKLADKRGDLLGETLSVDGEKSTLATDSA
jgi:hypothetical protein